MELRFTEQPVTAESLKAYMQVSIAFTVESRLKVELIDGGFGGMAMHEEPVERLWVKNYDEAESSRRWAEWWDLSNWTMFAAHDGDKRVGGAIMAWNTRGVSFLGRRLDTAALWDLRIAPEYRGRGIGSRLFAKGAEWARSKGCHLMKIETQDINVRACRFYRARGCRLAAMDRYAYRDFPEEVQLTWMLDL